MKNGATAEDALAAQRPTDLKAYDTTHILQWHVFLRIVISFFILFSTIAFQFSEILAFFWALIGTNVLVTLLSAFFIVRWHNYQWFSLFQVVWDILFVSALVYMSGGPYSLFTFMYILSVINASILLGKKGTISCAVTLLAGFTVITLSQYMDWFHPNFLDGVNYPVSATAQELAMKILLNGLAMLIAAVLSSKVTDQAKVINLKLRQKQTDLEELKALNEHMIQSLDIGLLSLDPKGKITFANQAVPRILKTDIHKFIGLRINKLFPRLNIESGNQGYPQDITFGHGSDRRFLSISTSVLTNDQEESIGWIISFQDVTEIRKMAEEIKRADKLAAVGKLAAGIAHEIRNPLASMSGSIQLLRSELDLDPVNQQLMDIVVRETDRLNLLITDFLIFARPGKMDPEIFDCTALLSDTLGILDNDPACKEGIQIVKHLHESHFVSADPDQIRQLFWNLFQNALHAMTNGGKLEVSIKMDDSQESGANAILVSVSDTGKGMKEETVNNIFDPFFTTKEMGSGLGLTTAYRIIENHQGRIWCKSAPGVGTTFFVSIPSV